MSPLDQGLHLTSSINLREQLPDSLTPSRLSSLQTQLLPEYNFLCTRVHYLSECSCHVPEYRNSILLPDSGRLNFVPHYQMFLDLSSQITPGPLRTTQQFKSVSLDINLSRKSSTCDTPHWVPIYVVLFTPSTLINVSNNLCSGHHTTVVIVERH